MKNTTLLLLCFVCSLTIQAQEASYKGPRTWKIISSLMGETAEKTNAILMGSGMASGQKQTDEELKLDSYSYIAANSPDPEYELPYVLLFSGGKSIAVYVAYAYNEEGTVLTQDLDELIKQLKLSGYALADKKTETHSNPFGDNTEMTIYFFKGPKNEARIYHDSGMATFTLSIGETKYQELFKSGGLTSHS